MKKTLTKLSLILGYCIPFVFLAMNEDAKFGSLWFYLIMIIGFGSLCCASVKTNNSWIIVAGNIISFASSCIFSWNFQTEKWEYYFKPFSPNQLIIFETIIAFVIQALIVHALRRKEISK